MKARRRCRPQRRRPPAGTRRTRRSIRKKPPAKSSTSKSKATVSTPTYFSLLADIEQALKVDHTEGASLQKLKRVMEQKYGGRKFNVASCKMFNSAIKRLRNRRRITKIHPNSSLFKFKPPMAPMAPMAPSYNIFGQASKAPFGFPPPSGGQKRQLKPGRARSVSTSRSMTIVSGSASSTQGSMSTRGSVSQSTSNSLRKPVSRARKPVSRAKRSRATVRRKR